MARPTENETWIIEAGDAVIHKQAEVGPEGLSPRERLIYCLWVADYGMRNSGDLETANDLHGRFQSEACELAQTLSLKFTFDTFSLTPAELAMRYFERFEKMCDEIKNA